jgi:pyruvate dehydrogenase E1 component alpha subunit
MTIAPPPSGPVPWAPEFALGMVRDMLRIRRMEERAAELYGEQKIRGFLHLYIGEEAVATGAIHALEAEDNIVATYREHGHALLRGMPMQTILAEMYGKREGCSRGRGGSMHLFDAKLRLYGGNAIVAGGLPLAVGLALADKLQEVKRVTACFFGEGAMAEGAFHEAMNLAALWKVPALFCAVGVADRPVRQGRLLRRADGEGRRPGHRRRARGVEQGAAACARRQGPVLRRVSDLPLPRALDVRS